MSGSSVQAPHPMQARIESALVRARWIAVTGIPGNQAWELVQDVTVAWAQREGRSICVWEWPEDDNAAPPHESDLQVVLLTPAAAKRGRVLEQHPAFRGSGQIVLCSPRRPGIPNEHFVRTDIWETWGDPAAWTIDHVLQQRLQSDGAEPDPGMAQRPEFTRLLQAIGGLPECIPPVVRSISIFGFHETLRALEEGLTIPDLFDAQSAQSVQRQVAERLAHLSERGHSLLVRLCMEGRRMLLDEIGPFAADLAGEPVFLAQELVDWGLLVRTDRASQPPDFHIPAPLTWCVLRSLDDTTLVRERAAWFRAMAAPFRVLEHGAQTADQATLARAMRARAPRVDLMLRWRQVPVDDAERSAIRWYYYARGVVTELGGDHVDASFCAERLKVYLGENPTPEDLELTYQADCEAACRLFRKADREAGLDILRRVQGPIEALDRPRPKAWLWLAHAACKDDLDRDFEEGARLLKKAWVYADEAGLPMLAARIASNVGTSLVWQERYAEAIEYYRTSAETARAAGATRLEAIAYVNQCLAASAIGSSNADVRRYAIRTGIDAVDAFIALQETYGQAVAHANLGMAYCSVLQLNQARVCFETALRLLLMHADMRQHGFAVHNLADLALMMNDLEAAERLVLELQELGKQGEDPLLHMTISMSRADIAAAKGNWNLAALRAEETVAIMDRSSGMQIRKDYWRWQLACFQALQGVPHTVPPPPAEPESLYGEAAQVYRGLHGLLTESPDAALVDEMLERWAPRLLQVIHEPEHERGLIGDTIPLTVWMALRRLLHHVPDAKRQQALDLAADTRQRTGLFLLVDSDRLSAHTNGSSWVSMTHRPKAFQLLRRLAIAHARVADAYVSTEELIETLWPGERMIGDSASGRLHSTFTQLRNLGFRDVIQRTDAGYSIARGAATWIWHDGLLLEHIPERSGNP